MATMAIPATTNVTVAASERAESLPMPHTPCPLVHPPPTRVPIPTSSPAIDTATRPRPDESSKYSVFIL